MLTTTQILAIGSDSMSWILYDMRPTSFKNDDSRSRRCEQRGTAVTWRACYRRNPTSVQPGCLSTGVLSRLRLGRACGSGMAFDHALSVSQLATSDGTPTLNFGRGGVMGSHTHVLAGSPVAHAWPLTLATDRGGIPWDWLGSHESGQLEDKDKGPRRQGTRDKDCIPTRLVSR